VTAAEWCLIIGKSVETFGAAFLCYVGGRVAYLEWFVGSRLQDADEFSAFESEGAEGQDAGLKIIKADLRKMVEHRRKQFGPKEAFCVGLGGVLIFLGCLIYLLGLILEHG
jgi:hypothetical protein